MPFQKGRTGNPTGRPQSAKQFKDALNVAIKRADGKKTKLAQIAEALVERAIAGDVPAINAVADRLDGKPTQTIAGDHDNPLIPRSVIEEAAKSLQTKLARLGFSNGGQQ